MKWAGKRKRSEVFNENDFETIDCLGQSLKEDGVNKALVLGTKEIMTGGEIRSFLKRNYDIDVVDTGNYPEEVEEIDRIIREELVYGVINVRSKTFINLFILQVYWDEKPDAIVAWSQALELFFASESGAN